MPLNKHIKILLYGGNIWYFGEGMLGPLFAVSVVSRILPGSFQDAFYFCSGFTSVVTPTASEPDLDSSFLRRSGDDVR